MYFLQSGDVQKVKRRKLEEEEEWQEKTVTFSSFQHFLNARLMDPRRTSEAFFSSHGMLAQSKTDTEFLSFEVLLIIMMVVFI